MNAFLTALLDFLFPPLCHVCRTFVPDAGALHICPSCREQMSPVGHPLCPVCGIPFQGAGADHLCGRCAADRPAFDAARAALLYEGHSRDLIHAFKYRNKTHLRRPLALLTAEGLTEFVASRTPHLIVPVPLHVRRLRSRGFNQAVLLGELLARKWRLPLARRALVRIRWTEPQINLTARERRDNVKGAFSVPDPAVVAGKRVLLLDDVLTTGSTVEECSRVLKRAGAAGVTVITVARAVT
ncbi:MAG TPA: ComF family protein [Desulfuromonadaceae bacterium]